MEKYGTWHLEGDRRDTLRRTLEAAGLRKTPLRRRFTDDNVLVTYRVHRLMRPETKISVRYESYEDAIPVLMSLEGFRTTGELREANQRVAAAS